MIKQLTILERGVIGCANALVVGLLFAPTLGHADAKNCFAGTNHKHLNGGGLVDDSAEVDASVFVGPKAAIKNCAIVKGNVKLTGENVIKDFTVVDGSEGGEIVLSDSAWVQDTAMVSGKVELSGSALVKDQARVNGKVKISGVSNVVEHAVIDGSMTGTGVELNGPEVNVGGFSQIKDNAKVLDYVLIRDSAQVTGNATAKGNSKLFGFALLTENALLTDSAILGGHSITSGKAQVGGQTIVNGRAHITGSASLFKKKSYYRGTEN